jgi:hypothetical protein
MSPYHWGYLMDIQIVPVRHEQVEGDHACLDVVARKLDGIYDDRIGMVLILEN